MLLRPRARTDRPSHLAFVLLCAGLLSASAGFAQAGPALTPDVEAALARGQAAVRNQEWELAIRYFSQAQENLPHSPLVLYHLALSVDEAGGRQLVALGWFAAYLAVHPTAPDIREVRRKMFDLEIQVEASARQLLKAAKEATAEVVVEGFMRHTTRAIDASHLARGVTLSESEKRRREESARRFEEQKRQQEKLRRLCLKLVRLQAQAGDIAGAKDTLRWFGRGPPLLDTLYILDAWAAGDPESIRSSPWGMDRKLESEAQKSIDEARARAAAAHLNRVDDWIQFARKRLSEPVSAGFPHFAAQLGRETQPEVLIGKALYGAETLLRGLADYRSRAGGEQQPDHAATPITKMISTAGGTT